MVRRMELRHLRYFVEAVEAGSITAASQTLLVAQPALSQQLASLERRLGVRLLDRSRTGVVPTAAGAALFERAHDLLARAEAAEALMAGHRPEAERHVRLGVPTGIPAEILDSLIGSFQRRHPGLALHLVDLNSSRQTRALHQGTLDVALLREPVEDPVLVLQPILKEPFGVALRDDDPLAAQQALSLGDLDGRPLICWARDKAPGFHDAITQACLDAGFTPHVVAEAADVVGALGRVAAGYGVHWLPGPAFHRYSQGLPQLTWRPLTGDPIVMRTSVAHLPHPAPRRATAALLDVLRRHHLHRASRSDQ